MLTKIFRLIVIMMEKCFLFARLPRPKHAPNLRIYYDTESVRIKRQKNVNFIDFNLGTRGGK